MENWKKSNGGCCLFLHQFDKAQGTVMSMFEKWISQRPMRLGGLPTLNENWFLYHCVCLSAPSSVVAIPVASSISLVENRGSYPYAPSHSDHPHLFFFLTPTHANTHKHNTLTQALVANLAHTLPQTLAVHQQDPHSTHVIEAFTREHAEFLVFLADARAFMTFDGGRHMPEDQAITNTETGAFSQRHFDGYMRNVSEKLHRNRAPVVCLRFDGHHYTAVVTPDIIGRSQRHAASLHPPDKANANEQKAPPPPQAQQPQAQQHRYVTLSP